MSNHRMILSFFRCKTDAERKLWLAYSNGEGVVLGRPGVVLHVAADDFTRNWVRVPADGEGAQPAGGPMVFDNDASLRAAMGGWSPGGSDGNGSPLSG